MAHFKSDVVFLTNDDPGVEWPDDIIKDCVAGLPQDVVDRYASASYPYLQVGGGGPAALLPRCKLCSLSGGREPRMDVCVWMVGRGAHAV
jgi:hypothetical protein